jgi:hypothetical protein
MRTVHFVAVLILALLFLLPEGAWSQNPVRVPPFTGTNYLNTYIMGDTLATGARRDSNAVYVLTRGGQYLSNAIIRNYGWTLRLKANDTTAGVSKPVVYLYPAAVGGNPPGNFVEFRGDVTVKNIIISGIFEPDTGAISKMQGSLFNATAAGFNITLDSCMLTNTNGNHVRTDAAPRTVRITNCTFANMGYLGRSNLGAGKAIDVRGGSVDSLIMVNNTFVNWQDRIIRHFSSTAEIKYLRFEHNTCVNGMSYHGLLSLGRMGRRAIIQDNLFMDAFAAGQDTDAVRQAEFTDSGEKDAFGFPRMTWVISVPNDTTQWIVKNNYYRVTPAGQAFYDSASILPIVANPALTVGKPLTYHINARIGADSATAFRTTTADMPKAPKVMTELMKWYRRAVPPPDSGAAKTKATGTWKPKYDYDRHVYQYYRDTLDCAYATSNAIYTAATGGYPVGDLNWFPTRYTSWKSDAVSDVALQGGEVPAVFSLSQNYPNPFNPSTRISFTVPKESAVSLEVYDMLGRLVSTLVNEVKRPGEYTVDYNAAQLSSGVYFYRLSAGGQMYAHKMMLLK